MEGLGVAASVIAVVDISAKVISLCSQYAKDVKNAKSDIDRLAREITNLQTALEIVSRLLITYRELESSQQLAAGVKDSRSRLEDLHNKLEPRKGDRAMSRIGLRALKWPFQSRDVNQIVEELVRCSQAISLALQVDQM
jgi:archaellum component FlaC